MRWSSISFVELARELDGLDVRLERTAEHALDERLDLVLDRAENHGGLGPSSLPVARDFLDGCQLPDDVSPSRPSACLARLRASARRTALRSAPRQIAHAARTSGSAGSAGAAISVPAIMNAARPAAAHGPRPRTNGQDERRRCPSVTASTSVARSTGPEVAAAASPGRSEVGDSQPIDPAHTLDRRDGEDGCRHLQPPPDRIADEQSEHRHEAEQADGGEQRPAGEQQAGPRLAPHRDEPDGRGDRVDDGERRGRSSRAAARERRGESEPSPGLEERERGGSNADPHRPAGGVEGQSGGGPRGEEERVRQGALRASACSRRQRAPEWRTGRFRAPRVRAPRSRSRFASADADGRRDGSWLSARSTHSTIRRSRSGRTEASERRAGLDPLRRVEQRSAPERVLAGQRLPEQHADRPDVGGRRGGFPLAAARARCTRACPECRRPPSASPPRA